MRGVQSQEAYRDPLSAKMEPYITEAQLDQNFAEHPLMQQEHTAKERVEIGAVAAHLLLMPLVHTFSESANIASMREQGLLPQVMRQQGGKTFPLDSSLGLDEYSFMQWGQMGTQSYGGTHMTIDGSVLRLDNTLVTRSDISAQCGNRENLLKPFREIPEDVQNALRRSYFGHAYRGKDWLEITARSVHGYVTARPGNLYPIRREMHLGEIKYHGVVPPDKLGDVVSKTKFEDRLIDLGIAPFGVSHILYPSTYSAYSKAEIARVQNRTAHAHAVWEKVLREA